VTEALTVRRVFLAVLFLGLFAMAARNVSDPDLCGILRLASLLSSTRAFLTPIPFLTLAPESHG
jgi:hypothetical protein